MENNVKIFNTLTRKVETFVPNEDGKVKMYTCGPTVYHFAHIGNLRSYIMEDVLEKTLRYAGYDVKRVMNITDVGHLSSDADTGEDKMLKGAKREHKTVMEIAKYYTDAFLFRLLQIKYQTSGCGRAGNQLYPGIYSYDRGTFRERLCIYCRRKCIF